MEQTKQLNMTAMSDKTNSNTTAKKEEPAWEHKVAMKVSGVSIAVNLLLSLFKLLAGILAHSGAMISDAIHSASDVGSTFVVIVGVNLSSKNPIRSISMDMSGWNVYLPLFCLGYFWQPVSELV